MGANVSASVSERPSTSLHGRPGPVYGPRPVSLVRAQNYHVPASDSDMMVQQQERKKKGHKFATLRKKLTRARRQSRSLDHAKAIRELTANWTIRELNALVDEYESSGVMKELVYAAAVARPHANSYKEDLSALYDSKYCTDVDLVYQGVVFPVHRAILSVRCPRFRELLARHPDYGTQVPVHIRTPGVDVGVFSTLLRYLYTGEFDVGDLGKLDGGVELLMRLGDEFGHPQPLEHDLRTLLDTGVHGDAVVAFCADADGGAPEPGAKHELRCHKAILAARSPFFRNLVLRRARSGEELTERALHSPTRIVLDESVIPRRYARVLLHALYTDAVDLGCIVRSSASVCSLSEVQAMVAGRGHLTLVDEAMEIYQIGQFLDLPILSQGCEDLIAESISVDNLISVLNWSREPHGSQWVYRQALYYLREEFLQIAHSPVLCDLSKEYMLHAIQSDFLQAGELDVLCATLRWGEHQLIKRMEEREPNLLSHTAHSVSKKGIKKRDLNDIELRDILAELLPHIRTDHILPPNHEVLTGAIKRGLVSRPPSHMYADEASHSTARAWVRVRNSGMFVKPRFFTPYYEEAKSLLEEQLVQVQENDMVRLRMIQMSNIPDMVQFMVDERGYPGHRHPPLLPIPPTSTAASVDIIAGTIPVPNPAMLSAMLKRQAELYSSKLVERAHSLPHTSARAISHYVQLRVVREFGLPDSMIQVLQSQRTASEEDLLSEARYHTPRHERHKSAVYHPHTLPCQHLHHHHHQHHHHLRHHSPCLPQRGSPHRITVLHDDQRCPSMPVSPVRTYSPTEKDPSPCSDSALSETMPDIAMATSAMNQLSLNELDLPQPDLELDLGDGSRNHSNPGTLYI